MSDFFSVRPPVGELLDFQDYESLELEHSGSNSDPIETGTN